jgi:AefR-like transcriptional repressor, C-terminal domain
VASSTNLVKFRRFGNLMEVNSRSTPRTENHGVGGSIQPLGTIISQQNQLRLSALASAPDMPVDKILEALFSVFEKEVLGTKRKLLIRLIIAEGPRFPRIAEFYYRNVVARILPLITKVAQRAVERGEFSSDAYARYPQLVAAPLLLTVIWDALFSAIKPLNVTDFLRAHRQALTGKMRAAS